MHNGAQSGSKLIQHALCVGPQVVDVDTRRATRDEDLQLRLTEHGEPSRWDEITQAPAKRVRLSLDAAVQVCVCRHVDVPASVGMPSKRVRRGEAQAARSVPDDSQHAVLVGDVNVLATRDQGHFAVVAGYVLADGEGEAQVRHVTLVRLEEHQVLVQFLVAWWCGVAGDRESGGARPQYGR